MPNTVIDVSTAQTAEVVNIGAPVFGDKGMELQDYREELLAQLQGRTDLVEGGVYTRLDRFINWGYKNIAGMLDLQELWASFAQPTVADQPFYNLPAAVAWMRTVNLDRGDNTQIGEGELAQIDLQTYRTLLDSDEVAMTPQEPLAQFRFGRVLVLWPTPDDVYSLAVDCRIRPLDLVEEQDCSLLPEEYDEAILYAALERAWRALRNPQAAAVAANDKLTVMRPLLDSDAEERASMLRGFAPARSRADLYRGRI